MTPASQMAAISLCVTLLTSIFASSYLFSSGNQAFAETEPSMTINGQLNMMDITYEDGSHEHNYVLIGDQTSEEFPPIYSLDFSDSIDSETLQVLVGREVQVKGKMEADKISVSSIVPVADDDIQPLTYQQGYPPSIIKQVILPAKYSGYYFEPHGPSFYESLFYYGGYSVKGYWQSASYGKTTLSGQAVNWQTLSYSSFSTEYFLALDAVKKADYLIDFNGSDNVIQNTSTNLGGPGDNGDDIDSIVIVLNGELPTPNAAGIGFYSPLLLSTNEGYVYVSVNLIEDLSSSSSTIFLAGLACHEMGHNFGWTHTPTAQCVYCDPWSIMSGSSNLYSDLPPGPTAYNKYEAGWISESDIITVTQPSTFLLNFPINSSDDPDAYRMAKIPYGSAGNYYVLEARQDSFYDSTPSGQSGLLIYSYKPNGHPYNPEPSARLSIVDTTGISDWANADLDTSQMYSDSANSIYIANIDQEFGGITVGVAFSLPAADAGSNQSVGEQESVVLDGSASQSPSGSELTYAWQVVSGPEVTITDSDKAVASFVAPTVNMDTELTLSLTVSDGGISDSDTVTISIDDTIAGNHGGPDNFGYEFSDSLYTDGPAFEWIDAKSKGTSVLSYADDGTVQNIPIGFNFNFYGTKYNQVNISSNGVLSFGSNAYGLTGFNSLLDSSGSSNFIAGYWDDLVASSSGVYYTTVGTAPERKFVVAWYDAKQCCYSSNGVTFEIILEEHTNDIVFQYQSVDWASQSFKYGTSATVGIKGGDGNSLQYSYNVPMIVPGLAIKFSSENAASQDNILSIHETGWAQLAKSQNGFSKGTHSITMDIWANYVLDSDVVQFDQQTQSGILYIDEAAYTVQINNVALSPDRKELTYGATVISPAAGTVTGKIAFVKPINFKKSSEQQTAYNPASELYVSIGQAIFSVNGPSGSAKTFSSLPASSNEAPVANAGPDQTDMHKGDQVMLDGSQSYDPDGDDITFSWTQSSDQSVQVSLSDPHSQNPTFIVPSIQESTATLTFNLVVNDGQEDSAADSVTVTIQKQSNAFSISQTGTATIKKAASGFESGSHAITVDISGSYSILTKGKSSTIKAEALSGMVSVSGQSYDLEKIKLTISKDTKTVTYSAKLIGISGKLAGKLKFTSSVNFTDGEDAASELMKKNTLVVTIPKLKFDVKKTSTGSLSFG